MRSTRSQFKKGFTLVEMLVVAPVVILAIGAFLTVIISMTGEVLSSRASNKLAYDIQDALNRIEEDVKLSTNFLAENNFDLNNGQGFDNGTTKFTNAGSASSPSIVLSMLATTGNPLTPGSSLVYLANAPNACASPQLKNNTPMFINVVYFIKPDPKNNNVSTLWRRTIMQPNYAAGAGVSCSTPWQQPSCQLQPNDSYVDSFCKTSDVKLVEGVTASDFSISYFTTAASTIPDSVASIDPSVQARNSALSGTPTANISITARQNVAGRDIERAASLRVSRLETNASSIATPQTPTTPEAPKVSASITAPTTAVFTWQNVDGATSYTYSSRINGGAWSANTSIPATDARTFSVSSATHLDVVEARITATNAAGTSTYGTATATVPLWTPFSFQNGWTDYGGAWKSAGYTKTSSGLVVLNGLLKRHIGTSAADEIITILPEGYRPPGTARYLYQSIANSTNARIDIHPNGEVHLIASGKSDLTLNNISFMPNGTTFTNISYQNGWTTYGDSNYAVPLSYTNVGNERTEIRGMVAGGSTPDNTVIGALPTSNRPPQYLHVPAQISGVNGTIGIDSNIRAKGGPNSWQSIHSIFVNSSRATGTNCTTQWCALPLQGGWLHYSGYATNQYTKHEDGMVHLKGLISAGSTTNPTIIANLPAGYRPSGRLLFQVQTNNGLGRIDVEANGNVVLVIGNNSWLSLDGVSFMAEQ